jgi:hypothetical protein
MKLFVNPKGKGKVGGEWSVSHPGRFTPREKPLVPIG